MQVTLRLIVGIASFSVAMTGTIVANSVMLVMVGEVNHEREPGNRISPIGFTLPKILRVLDEYRRANPGGKKHVLFLGSLAVAFSGLAITAVCMGFFG